MLKVIAVKDVKTSLFDQPFFTRHNGQAIRDFETVCKDPKTKFGLHPADYELYQIANYNDETGVIEPMDTFVHLANGVDCVTPA